MSQGGDPAVLGLSVWRGGCTLSSVVRRALGLVMDMYRAVGHRRRAVLCRPC